MSKLSKENYDKLDEHKLYKADPYEFSCCPDTTNRCWTFKVEKTEDGKAFMVDTYDFRDKIEVTDENIDKFEVVFDFREVKEIPEWEAEEDYDDEDVYEVFYGHDCDGYIDYTFWVKRTAKKSKRKAIKKIEKRLEKLRNNLESIEKEINELKGGNLK